MSMEELQAALDECQLLHAAAVARANRASERADEVEAELLSLSAACRHPEVATTRSYPPRSVCETCGVVVVRGWVAEYP